MVVGALSGGWMRGCPCGALPGFYDAPWGLLVAWVLEPSLPASDCWGVAVSYILHVHAHTLSLSVYLQMFLMVLHLVSQQRP